MLGRLAFYLPLLSIKVVAKFPGILPGALSESYTLIVIERLASVLARPVERHDYHRQHRRKRYASEARHIRVLEK
jgi:hypothetical protein